MPIKSGRCQPIHSNRHLVLPRLFGLVLQNYAPIFPWAILYFPPAWKGLMRSLFHAPDFVFPPSIFFLPLLNPFANDITCLHIVTRCLPTHLSSVCSSEQTCPVLPAPLFFWPKGRCVCEGGRGRGVSPTATCTMFMGRDRVGQGENAAGKTQLYQETDSFPPPPLALTDDLAGTAALGLPTDISWYNGLDWTCHTENAGAR